jgi:hypothetical protein
VSKPRPSAEVPVIAVTREEAARALGVSVAHFDRHIAAHLRVIQSGRARLFPIIELQRWAERSAVLAPAEILESDLRKKRTGGAGTPRPMAHQE